MSKQIRQVIMKLSLLVLSVLVTLLFMEGLIRLISPHQTSSIEYTFDPVLGDLSVPNQTGFVDWPGVNYYTYHNNSLGMRGGEWSLTKSKPRILLLGDSFTYGQQVNDNQTFASVLQAQTSTFEVLNGGNPGKGTDYQLTFYNYLGYKYQPDIVFFFFKKSDFGRNARQIYYGVDDKGDLAKKVLGSSLGSKKEFLQHLPGYPWLMEHSQFANLLKHTFVAFLLRYTNVNANNSGSDLVHNDQNDAPDLASSSVAITSKLMGALKNSVLGSRSKFVIFFIPDSLDTTDFRAGKGISSGEKATQQIIADSHIDFFSLSPALAQSSYTIKELYVGGNGHFGVDGNKVVGLALSDYIKQYQPWLLK